MPALKAKLDGLVVTAGGLTLTFSYVEWGKHWDRNSYPANRGLFSARSAGHPRRPTDIGGGASGGRQLVDVHAWWEDNASLTDAAAFRRGVVKAIEDAIRPGEKTFADAYYVFVVGDVDASEILAAEGQPASTLANHHIVQLEASTSEVYA